MMHGLLLLHLGHLLVTVLLLLLLLRVQWELGRPDACRVHLLVRVVIIVEPAHLFVTSFSTRRSVLVAALAASISSSGRIRGALERIQTAVSSDTKAIAIVVNLRATDKEQPKNILQALLHMVIGLVQGYPGCHRQGSPRRCLSHRHLRRRSSLQA